MKKSDILLAIGVVFAIAALREAMDYVSQTGFFEKRRNRDVTIIYRERRSAPEPRRQMEDRPNKDMDWSWIRKGARMYNEDGTLIKGGPIQVKPKKMPIVYGDPSKGEATTPVPASEQNTVDPRDRADELWDTAFELSDGFYGPGDQ
jgi:hypothetical protein